VQDALGGRAVIQERAMRLQRDYAREPECEEQQHRDEQAAGVGLEDRGVHRAAEKCTAR